MKDHDYNNYFNSSRQSASRPTLTELAIKWGVDKHFNHSYIPTYTKLFENMRVHRLLEIGIGYEGLMAPFVPFYRHGASLHMWSEYWPDSNIYACDIREDALINEGNIKSWVADQSKEHDLERLVANCGGQLNVVVDDGSHLLEHQQISARVLLPWMLPGNSIYVIEDCYPDTGKVLVDEFGGELIVGTKRPDDCLVVIRK